VEGRRDLDAAAPVGCCRARAAGGSRPADVAGPGVAGPAGRDRAGRAPLRDAADRHSRHRLALAPRHRAPPVGAPVAPGPFRGALPRTARSGQRCCGWPGGRVLGLSPHPRRARRARHHRGAAGGVAGPQERRDRPGAAPGRPGVDRVPAVPGAGDPGAGLLHRRSPQRHGGLCPGRDRAWRPPCPGPGATENPAGSG
jgi:hypothetical protein